MFSHAFSSGVPTAVLDMTKDFTPVFVGMVLLMGFCVLAFAFALAVHDTREAQRRSEQKAHTAREFQKAA